MNWQGKAIIACVVLAALIEGAVAAVIPTASNIVAAVTVAAMAATVVSSQLHIAVLQRHINYYANALDALDHVPRT